jgi:hypothetical protein
MYGPNPSQRSSVWRKVENTFMSTVLFQGGAHMPFQNNILTWMPIVVLLTYAPILCWLDIRYRDIFSHAIWLPAIIINGIFFVAAFNTGVYAWWTVALSLVGVVFWYAAMLFGIINGADFVYLALINVFAIYNPISGYLMYLPLMVFLFIWMGLSIWYIFAKNIRDGLVNGMTPKDALIRALLRGTTVDRGFPMMVPISLALLCALLFG